MLSDFENVATFRRLLSSPDEADDSVDVQPSVSPANRSVAVTSSANGTRRNTDIIRVTSSANVTRRNTSIDVADAFPIVNVSLASNGDNVTSEVKASQPVTSELTASELKEPESYSGDDYSGYDYSSSTFDDGIYDDGNFT